MNNQNKIKKTCLSLDCPERTGGECTAGETICNDCFDGVHNCNVKECECKCKSVASNFLQVGAGHCFICHEDFEPNGNHLLKHAVGDKPTLCGKYCPPGFNNPEKKTCGCVCHSKVKPLEHETKCREKMNGVLESDTDRAPYHWDDELKGLARDAAKFLEDNADWSKRFDNYYRDTYYKIGTQKFFEFKEPIKSFISNLLAQEREKMVEKMKKLKTECISAPPADEIERVDERAYCAALNDAIKAIEHEK